MELRHLRHVLALAEHGSFHRAAEALGLTQPALTKSLQQLEGEVGVRLFDRHGRRAVPTRAGQLVVETARDVVRHVEELPVALGRLSGLAARTLAIGVGPYVADVWLGPIVGRLLKANPQLRLDVVVDDWTTMPELLRRGRVELFFATVEHVVGLSEFRVREAPPQEAIWVARAGHPLAGRLFGRDALRGFPLIGPPAPESIRSWLLAGGGALSVLDRKIDTTSVEFLKAMIRDGDAVSLVLPLMVRHELDRGEFTRLEFDAPPLRFRGGLAWLADAALSSPAVEFVNEFLREFDLPPEPLPSGDRATTPARLTVLDHP